VFYSSEYDNGDDFYVMVLLTADCVSDNDDDDDDDKDIEKKIRSRVKFVLSS